VLTDQLLAERRQALELRVTCHEAPLLDGGQFTQTPETASNLGPLLSADPTFPAVRFRPTRGIRTLIATALGKDLDG